MSRAVLLFPGQGAYFPGVLRDLGMRDPVVKRVFGTIDEVAAELNEPECVRVLFEESPQHIDDLVANFPDVLQLALFGTSVVMYDLLHRAEMRPWMSLGHSLGEIAALTCAGAFSVADGVRIIHLRNRALRDFAEPGAMVALTTDFAAAQMLVRLIDVPGLTVACHNAPRQCVLSGPVAALDQVVAAASALGIGHHRIRAAYPFHSELLAGVVEPFRAVMDNIPQHPLNHPVYSSTDARPYRDDDDLRSCIATNLVRPVTFHDAVRTLRLLGADEFVECGARDILSRLAQATAPRAEVRPGLLPGRDTLACIAAVAGRTPAAPTSPLPTPALPIRNRNEAEPAVTPPPVHVPELPDSPDGRREGIIAELCAIYAQALEYPLEMVTEDVDLEADLGVDSVMQTEILAQVATRFNVTKSENLRMVDYPTVGAVADLVQLQKSR